MSGQQHLMRFRFAPWNGGQHPCNKDIEVGRELRGQMEEAVFQNLYDSLAFAELRQSNVENFPGNRSRLGGT
jgi:hypothetical protein